MSEVLNIKKPISTGDVNVDKALLLLYQEMLKIVRILREEQANTVGDKLLLE